VFGECVVGRPFIVDGEVRTGGEGTAAGWKDDIELDVASLPATLRSEVAAAWLDAAEHEHASIVSFSHFMLDLMALGAPAHLIEATTRAIDDEVRHARACFAIASAYAGTELGPGPIDIRGAESTGDAEKALVAAIREGCIGETLAGVIAEWQAPRVKSETMRETLQTIADEEGDHALLAWQFAQWLIAERPELREVARRAFEEAAVELESPWATGGDVADSALVEHGVLRAGVEDHLRRRAFHDVVMPCADAIL
jgi:hypothetical protein